MTLEIKGTSYCVLSFTILYYLELKDGKGSTNPKMSYFKCFARIFANDLQLRNVIESLQSFTDTDQSLHGYIHSQRKIDNMLKKIKILVETTKTSPVLRFDGTTTIRFYWLSVSPPASPIGAQRQAQAPFNNRPFVDWLIEVYTTMGVLFLMCSFKSLNANGVRLHVQI